MKLSKSRVIISFIYGAYSLSVWRGGYGFGVDYYIAYNLGNISHWGGIFDKLGFAISSLSIGGYHLGVLIVTSLVSLSIYYSLCDYFWENNFSVKNNITIFTLISLLILHTWPVIMANVNVMRQGLMMAFFYLSISSFHNEKNKLGWINLIIMLFMHKSSVVFFYYILSSLILKWFNNYFTFNRFLNKFFIFFYGSFSALLILYVVPLYFGNKEASRVIGFNASPVFIVINILYILYYNVLLSKNKYNTLVSRVLLLASFVNPIFFIYGFNWEYERLNMALLVLYIIDFSFIFRRSLRLYYLLASFLSLVLLTILTGIFSSLH